jgi:hypothetical protein
VYRVEVLALAKVEGIIVKKQKSKKKREKKKRKRIKWCQEPFLVGCDKVNRQSECEGPTLVQIRCPLKQLN